jgi:predicted transport protein
VSDLKLFHLSGGTATEIDGSAMALEKSLQTLMERNLEVLLGVRFLATEYSTGRKHRGRIDTLGIDENGSPVIIEYKRATNENVINQGLFYLDWLMDHRAEFKLLVMERYGADEANRIDWSSPRLLCIAGDFTRYDEHAVQQMNRNIELIRYRKFGEDLLLLELVNAVSGEDGSRHRLGTREVGGRATPGITYKTITEAWGTSAGAHRPVRGAPGLPPRPGRRRAGEDAQVLRGLPTLKNFVCVEARAQRGVLVMFLKVDPDTVEPSRTGSRATCAEIGHFGTGDLEVVIASRADLERAKPLILRAYEGG